MQKQLHLKQERIIEAVRRGLEGDALIGFIHESGYAINPMAVLRFLRIMGGRIRIQEGIARGLTNREILQLGIPEADLSEIPETPPRQVELFENKEITEGPIAFRPAFPELFETTKMTLSLPSDLYESVRLAAKAEGKSKTQLIVDILTTALSRTPMMDRHS